MTKYVDSTPLTEKSDIYSALSISEASPWKLRYWSIFVGQALSLIGSALTQFVLLWWITDTTNSVSALAMAGLFALLPQALLGPIGGTFADRYSRRFLMITADVISALCMLVLITLFATHQIELWHVYTMMFIRSAMQAFQQPAANASTAMLVPASFISRAAGLNQTLNGIMLIAAAPLGALAMSFMPIGYALSIDVTTALLGILPLFLYRIPQPSVKVEERSSVWNEFREGCLVVWKNPGLRILYTLLAAVTLVIMPSMTLVPLLVKEHFGGGAPEVAFIEGLGGAGMIVGGALITIFNPKRKVLWVLWGFALSCFTLSLTALAASNMFLLAAFWWSFSSLLYILGNGPLTALIQTTIPNQLQGRALALLGTFAGFAAPVGLAITSPLGELIGVRWLFIILGALAGIITLLGFLSPGLRKLNQESASATEQQNFITN